METFSFLIPNGVIAEMGLVHDGMTVSKQVRIGDLVAGGKMSMNEYHALASAGMVFVTIPVFTFVEVEETLQGWTCKFPRRDWRTTLKFISLLFPGAKLGPISGGKQSQLWLPEPPPRGFIFKNMLVKTSDVVAHKGYCVSPNGRRCYSFKEGLVTIEPTQWVEWVEMDLHTELSCGRSYLAGGGRYEISLDYIKLYY
jgi:hypothetical protein